MSRDKFSELLMDSALSRRELVTKLTALGLSAPVAMAIAGRMAPAAHAAPAEILTRKGARFQNMDGTLIVGTAPWRSPPTACSRPSSKAWSSTRRAPSI